MRDFTGFAVDSLAFLQQLANNNNKEWFSANKDRYEQKIREPALAFIDEMGPRLREISPKFIANAKKLGRFLYALSMYSTGSSILVPHQSYVGGVQAEALYKMRYIPLLLVIAIVSSLVQAGDMGKEFLANFVLGKYLLVGKKVDSSETYFGHVELYSEHENIKIKRVINGKSVLGQAAIESAVQGDATVLRMRFDDNGAAYENNCLIQSDLDNYARISCYLYQPGVRTLNPGLEVLFIDHGEDVSER